jgi:RimJ/RimL family protein N-acetyltransferase
MVVLEGSKVLLFPFAPKDGEYLVELLSGDEKGFMGQFSLAKVPEEAKKSYLYLVLQQNVALTWVVQTKEGKASKKIGFIILSKPDTHSATLEGILDPAIVKDLVKVLKRKDKYTYAEDAVRTVCDFAFHDLQMERIETLVRKDNKASLALMDRAGFAKEGEIRNAVKLENGKMVNSVLFGKLKGE